MRRLALLCLALLCAGPARAAEEVVKVPLETDDGRFDLETTFFRPDGLGPFPLIVINHGSPREAARRRAPRWRPVQEARWFMERGFAVAVPMRRGYAGSGGDWAERYGPCDQARYYEAGLETARDIRAAALSLAARPDIDPNRILLLGQSAGGFGALAAASQGLPGLRAVINFAGGRGSRKTGLVCSQAALIDAVSRYGRTSGVPTLWLYSDNDGFFPPALAHAMHSAYRDAGGQAEFAALPPFGADGHAVFSSDAAMPLWTGIVERFLKTACQPSRVNSL